MGINSAMNKTALITGASRGLGAALAERFWNEGYDLILIAKHEMGLKKLAANLAQKENQSCQLFFCDFNDSASVFSLIKQIKESHKHLDVLINNAAIQGPIGPLWENDLNEWQQCLQINLITPMTLCKELIPLLQQSNNASIINLSGGGATSPRPHFSAYAAAKAGLVRMSETLAEELKSFAIRVNCIAPGTMKTNMIQEIVQKGEKAAGYKEYRQALTILENNETSFDHVTDLIIFLASNQSSNISGKLISAQWDHWEIWSDHPEKVYNSDLYTLRRITGRDRSFAEGDR
jgi:3-oxoacyl-[acyl-carrier protein] reductase